MQTKYFTIKPVIKPALLVLAILIGLELLLHQETVQNVLPSPIPYYDSEVEMRRVALERFLKKYDQPDILFIGSSVVRSDISPVLFDSVYQSITNQTIHSFGGGLSDLDPDPVAFYFNYFWIPKCKPKAIVQTIRYEELSSPFTADNYKPFKNSLIEPLWLKNTWFHKTKIYLIEHIKLFYYSGSLTEFLRYPRWPMNRPIKHPIDSRGWSPMTLEIDKAIKQGYLKGDYRYNNDLAGENCEHNLKALQEIIAYCHQEGIPYVLINIPEHPTRFAPELNGIEKYQTYLEILQKFSQENNIPFIDITNGNPAYYPDNSYFSDYYHLMGSAAKQFTSELAHAYAGLNIR
jgi:hypothetical protein